MKIHVLESLLGPLKRTEFDIDEDGVSVARLIARFGNPAWTEGAPIVAVINGGPPVRGDAQKSTLARRSDDVVIVPDMGDPVTLTFIGNVILAAIVSTILSFAYAALVGVPKVEQQRGEGDESATNKWDGMTTNYGSGFPIQIVYGIHRIAGQVISGNVYEKSIDRDVLALLISLGEGPFDQIAGVDLSTRGERNNLGKLFNNNPVETLAGVKVQGVDIAENDVSYWLRSGTQFQTAMAPWLQSFTTFSVNIPLRHLEAATYTTSGTSVGQVRVRLRFDALFSLINGKRATAQVIFQHRRRKVGQTVWNAWTRFQVNLLKASAFNWSFVIDLPELAQWEIELERLTTNDGPQTVSTSTWQAVVEGFSIVADSIISYPNLALLSVELLATERLQSTTPTITVPVRGRPVSHWTSLSGWEGPHFFETATSIWWGRDPAWILADFLTNTRYGLGNYISVDDLDLDSFEQWSLWNQVQVDDGESGTHERNFFDGVIDAREDAWSIVMAICRVGNAVPVVTGNKIRVKFEHPDDLPAGFGRPSVQLFTRANMTDFQATWTDNSQRPNILDMQILNEDEDYEQDLISIEDPDAFGLNKPWLLQAEFVRRQTVKLLPGVTRPQHARRIGHFMHATNRLLFLACEFTVGIDSLAAEVGDRISVETDVAKFFDSDTDGPRTTTAEAGKLFVKLDTEVVLAPATSYEVFIKEDSGDIVTNPVTSAAGTYPVGTQIDLGGSTRTYNKGAVVAIGEVDASVKDFIITAIGMEENLQRRVKAVVWDEDVFTIPSTVALTELGITDPGAIGPAAVQEADVVTADVSDDGTEALILWATPADARGRPSRVYMRKLETATVHPEALPDDFLLVWEGVGSEAPVQGLTPGVQYEASVVIQEREGMWKGPGDSTTQLTFTAAEFPGVSPEVPEIDYISNRERGIEIGWSGGGGETLQYFEIRRGPFWNGAVLMGRTKEHSIRLEDAAYGTALYQVRARHKNGLYSGEEKLVNASVGVPEGMTLGASIQW